MMHLPCSCEIQQRTNIASTLGTRLVANVSRHRSLCSDDKHSVDGSCQQNPEVKTCRPLP